MASRSVRFVMTPAPTAITADSSLADAARVMRDENIGDVLVLKNDQLFGILTEPVLENGVPVGIVSLGDLAQETDPDSALGIISGARPNT